MWVVYGKDGARKAVLRSILYGGTFMGERAITATFSHHEEVDFDVFDYIVYRGEKFELESIPTVKKVSRYEYEYELRFVSLKYELERCEMRDLVPSDNGVIYPTPLTFSFTGDVRYLAERIQACLDSLYGDGVWTIVIAEGVKSEEKNITIAQQNCWNALALVNTAYGLNFHTKGRTITIGGEQPLIDHVFEYGKGNGLYEIERAADTDTGIVTKLRAFGGTRNLDYSYPKQPEWSDSVLPVSFAFSPLRLMLPSFKKDGKTDFVLADDATIAKYGIREASMVYEDIYPTITGATNAKGERIDKIKSVEPVDDEKSTFVIGLYDLGFDLEEHLTTSNAQISMKTGTLQGYTFELADGGVERLSDGGYKITLTRNSLESSEESGFYVPSSSWNMAAGDEFVLLNALMPQEYIRDAEERLQARAEEYIAQYGKTNFSYNIGLHDKFLVEHPSLYESLIEGSKLSVYDAELGISEEVTIQSVTITENAEDNTLPQVKVTLNNQPSASTLDRIQGQIDALANESAANNFTTQSEIMAQYRKKVDKPFFDKLFAAVDANGNEIPSNDVITPISYIKAKYHFATIGGVTMFIKDNNIEIPTIAQGLPFDGQTIWYNPETNQIEVLGGTGGGSGEGGVSNFWDLTGIPWWITNTKPEYKYSEIKETPNLGVYALKTDIPSLNGYATESWVLGKNYALNSDLSSLASRVNDFLEGSDTDNIINKWKELESFLSGLSESDNLATILGTKADKNYVDKTFVTIQGNEDVTGVHSFVNGLKVGDIELKKSKDDVVYLDGNLVVKGGVTMYGSESVDTPSIYDGLPIDGDTIYWEYGSNGKKTVLKARVGTEGAITEVTPSMIIEALGYTPYNSSNPSGYITSSALNGYATQDWVTKQGFLTQHQDLSGYQTKITSSNKLAYSLISGTPTSLKNPTSLKFGSKSYDGSSEQSILASDLGALTSHQTIYALTFQSGIFSAGSFTANSSAKTINIPTTTSHISEGTNLYFTNARAVSALSETLKAYVTLAGSQTITGEKNFTGGLKVNGSPIVYDATKKYWKLEGDLLVTGGVTMYGNEGTYTPSTIMDAISVDGTTISKEGGVLRVIGGTGGGSVEGLASVAYSGKYDDLTGKPTLLSSFTDDVISGKYLPLSGGVLTSNGVPLYINRTEDNSYALIGYRIKSNEIGYLGFSTDGNLVVSPNRASGNKNYYGVWHSGNFTPSDYLPLSGGTINGNVTIKAALYGESYISWKNPDNNEGGYFYGTSLNASKNYAWTKSMLKWNVDTGIMTFEYTPLVGNSTIWHSGNDGSGSGLDADLLDGYHVTHFMSYIKENGYVAANLLNSELWNVAGGDGYIEYYDNGTWFNSRWGKVLAHNGFYGDLRGNASSATKLQTARTIWGRTFDGTSDITGSLYITNNNAIYIKDASDNWLNQIEVSSGNAFNIGYSSGGRGYSTLMYGGDITLKVGTSRVTSLYIDSNRNGEYNGMFTFKRASQVPLYISNTDSSLTDVCARFVVNNAYKASIGTNSGDYLLRYNADLSKSYVIWDSGNDGHNSGLDADTLDGYHSNAFMNFTATGSYVEASMGNETLSKQAAGNGYIEFWDGAGGWFNFRCGYVKSLSSMYIASSLFLGDGGEGIYIHGTGVSWHNSSNTWTKSIMYINSNGDVCIGNQQPSARLHVLGDILATGGMTMYSMRKLKNVVDERGLSLSELSAIKPTRYTWKDCRDNRLHIGGIADDIEQVLPEVVYKTSEGILTMDYGNAAFAVAASLIKPVVDHEKRIAMLEKENKQLRQEVERLKST